MKNGLKTYGFFTVIMIMNLFTAFFLPEAGLKSFGFAVDNVINFLLTLTPIFICIGLLDVWVKREALLEMMGEQSGLRGVLVSFLLGVVTAVPVYALLPVAGVLLKKGCKLSNVLIFICSCTSIRIPLLLFEVSSLGLKFTAIRFGANIIGVLLMAFIIDQLLTEKDKTDIYENANNIDSGL